MKHQAEKRMRSWELSVVEHRERALLVLEDNASLRPVAAQVLAEAYRLARVRAARQTGLALAVFPKSCEWTVEEVLNPAEPEI